MDKAAVAAALTECLLTDAEMDMDWVEFSNPFMPLVAPMDDDEDDEDEEKDDEAASAEDQAAGDAEDEADGSGEEECGDEDEDDGVDEAMEEGVVTAFRIVRKSAEPATGSEVAKA
jgi:hypothetical protein